MTKGTFFPNVLDYFGESKIPKKEKIWITILTVIYILSPLDLMPGLPFDDIGVLGVALAYMNWRMKQITKESAITDATSSSSYVNSDDTKILPSQFFSQKK